MLWSQRWEISASLVPSMHFSQKLGTLTRTKVEGGTVDISARYCPANGATGEEAEVVELLTYGGSYTKD